VRIDGQMKFAGIVIHYFILDSAFGGYNSV